MNEKIDDGGPAFPHGEIVQDMLDEKGRFVGNRVLQASAGMTLRDWFAGQALAGILSEGGSPASYNEDAENAYSAADAMIAARKKGGAE